MNLKQIAAEKKYLTDAHIGLLYTKNSIIDNFNAEYERHVKLACPGYSSIDTRTEDAKKMGIPRKKLDPKILSKTNPLKIQLNNALKRSRNMKKYKEEMISTKNRIKENRIEYVKLKLLFKNTERKLCENINNLLSL